MAGKNTRRGRSSKNAYTVTSRGPPVRFNIARLVSKKDGAIKGNNPGLYEDVMLFVKDQCPLPKKRGRPKKCLAELNVKAENPTEVIYVPPPSKSRAKKFVPQRKTPLQSLTDVKGLQICRPCGPYGMQSTARPILANEAFKPRFQVGRTNFPDDLEELVLSWDHLPERELNKMVMYLTSKPDKQTEFPPMVKRFHKTVAEWQGTEDDKLRFIDDVLLEDLHHQTSVKKPPVVFIEETGCNVGFKRPTKVEVAPPKVVVEAQPNNLHNYFQWSSMA